MSTIIQKTEWRFPVENSFVRDTTISVEARLLYIIIKGYAGPDCEMPFPSLGTLARHMDRHRESVQKYLLELEAAGYIKREHAKIKGKFVSTRYALFDRSGKKPLRKLPTTEISSTKSNQFKEIPYRERKVKGAFVKAPSKFSPRYAYPETEEEMIETLEAHEIEYSADYDGQFFDTMTKCGWTIRGLPVYDWIATYEARLQVTSPANIF